MFIPCIALAKGGNRRFIALCLVGVGLIAGCVGSGQDSRQAGPSIQYTVINDEVDESPGKTQVAMDLLVPQDASEVALREVLLFLYDEARQRTGFQYHSEPTIIGIYAYPSREHAASGMGQWSAMLIKTPRSDDPTINIAQSVGQPEPPSERFGFSTEQRIEIFGRIVTAEDRGQADAERRAPIGDTPTLADFTRQSDLASELGDQYKGELASELGLTQEQLDEIALEGFQNNWSFPEL